MSVTLSVGVGQREMKIRDFPVSLWLFLPWGQLVHGCILAGKQPQFSVFHKPCFLRIQRRWQEEEAEAEGRVQEEEADQRAPLDGCAPAKRPRPGRLCVHALGSGVCFTTVPRPHPLTALGTLNTGQSD